MKTTQLTFIAIIHVIIAACCTTKKSTLSSTGLTSNPVVKPPLLFTKPANGIYAPGNEELIAIQTRYKNVTLDQLKEGHVLYTVGACVNCHSAINIYTYDETQWSDIIDNMAEKAYLSDAQKDAVHKYVLAIKARQPK